MEARTKNTYLHYVKSACIGLLCNVFFFSSCSSWKNRLVSHVPFAPYAYQGDTIQQWSLIRLDNTDGSWGYVSADGKSAIQPLFEWADDFTDSMALVRDQEYYTFVNQQGKQFRRLKAPHAYAFSEGLAAVQKGDKWGYIDRRGKWVIKPQFDWALPFSEKRAAVAVGRHYGFINPQGKMIIAPEYENIKPLSNNLAIVQKNGKYGLIDTLGQEILQTQYHRIEPWKKATYRLHVSDRNMGLADSTGRVMLDTIYSNMTVYSDDNFIRVVNQSVGLYDFNGREILPPQYFFLGFISDEGFLVAVKDGKYGIVDTAGKTLLPFIYDNGHAGFAEGRFVVHKRLDGQQEINVLLMDTTFQVIKELPYNSVYAFSNGFAIVEQQNEKDPYQKQYGYINRRGEEVIPPQYHSAFGFNQHGLTIVGRRKEGITSQFIIDTTGTRLPLYIAVDHLGNHRPVYDPIYESHPASMHSLKPFGDRLFYNKSGSNFTFISPETGHILYTSTFPYQSFSPLSYSDRNDLATVRIDSLVGLIDTTLHELLPVKFDDISTYIRDRIAVKHEGKWGFADEQFKFRIPSIYDEVSSFRYGYATVEQKNQKGIIDPKGRFIIPLRYKKITVDTISNRIYAEKERGNDIYDLYGRLLLSSSYEYVGGFWGKSYTTFRQGKKTGILDIDFRVVCEPQYDRIGPLYDGRAWVVDGNKGGFLDSNFQVIIPIEYDYIEDFAHSFTRVEKDDESFYIDVHGKRIQPSEEDIASRKEVLEQRQKGFIDFSS